MPHAPPPSLAEAQLVTEVLCRRCAYDLRGLTLDGKCPECGLDIWLSVQHVIDPAASRLPKLRDPVGVGNGLVWLVFCGLLMNVIFVIEGVCGWMGTGLPGPWPRWMDMPTDLLFLSGIFAFAGLWSVYKFSPPAVHEKDTLIHVNLRVLSISLIALGLCALVLGYEARTVSQASVLLGFADAVVLVALIHIGMAVAATLVLYGLNGVLRTIGQRSREYRRAQGSRQGIRPMMGATIGVAVGSIVRIISALWWDYREILDAIGTTLVRTCMIMLLIGMVYLLMNALWIKRALKKPPPLLNDLIRIVPK